MRKRKSKGRCKVGEKADKREEWRDDGGMESVAWTSEAAVLLTSVLITSLAQRKRLK